MRRFGRDSILRASGKSRAFCRRPRGFEALETRQMLNAAPVANDDSYMLAEDTALSNVRSLPEGATIVRWSENGHYYTHIPTVTTWLNAETTARTLSYLGSVGHLVTITSAEEQAFIASSVVNQLPSNARAYIGLTDRDTEATYRWVTGEAFTYNNWRAGEPNNFGGDEDYAEMSGPDWHWNDLPGGGNYGNYLIEFDGPFTNPVLANDTDADNNPLTAAVVIGPQHGSLVLNADGTFTYAPNAEYFGPDSFTYKANDGQANSNVATVTITVTPVNDAPKGISDSYTVPENGSLSIDASQGVLSNDIDQEQDPMSASLVKSSAYGQLTLNSNGSFLYTPSANYYGGDSFTYRASDATGQSQPITVSLTINSDGDGSPVALNDVFTINEDTSLNMTTDPLTTVYTVSLPTGDLLYDSGNDRILASVLGSGGARANTITPIDPYTGALGTSLFVGVDPRDMVSSDGRTIHVVTEDRLAIQSVDIVTQTLGPKLVLSAGYIGQYPERVKQIYAIAGQPDAVMVTRYTAGINPSVSGTSIYKAGVELPEYSGRGTGTGGADITAIDTDGTRAFGYETYSGHYPFYILSIVPTGLRGVQTLDNGTFLSGNIGSFKYSRDRIFVNTGVVKQFSTNTVVGHFEATDNFVIDETANMLFAVTVSDTTQIIHIYDLDTIAELDTITLSGQPIIQGSLMRFGTDGLAFRGVGDKVVVVQSDKISGTSLRGVLRNDSDPDGAALSTALVAGVSHGTLTFNNNGTFTYVPQPNYNGVDTFTYRVNDGQSNSNTATVTLYVNAVNDPPVANPESYSVVEDNVLTVPIAQSVLKNDTDLEGDPLTASIVTGPIHGTVVLAPDGSFTYTPNPNFYGTDTFNYRASDVEPSQPATVTIEVSGINEAPVAVNDTVYVDENTPLSFTGYNIPQGLAPVQWSVNGHYYSVVMGAINWPTAKAAAESLVYHGVRGHLVALANTEENQFVVANVIYPGPGNGRRLWIGLTDDAIEGTFRWVTGEALTFTRWSGGAPNNGGGIEHYVEMVNIGSVGSAWNDNTAIWQTAGYVVEFDTSNNNGDGILGNDLEPDNDPMIPQLVSGPAHGAIALNADGTFTYTPDGVFIGTDSFNYRISDGQLQSNVATVSLVVVSANDPPVALADNYFVGDTLTVNAASGLLANDTDEDSPTSSFIAQLVTPPTDGTLTLNADGSFTYVRGASFSGHDTFTYRTSDGSATSAPVTVTIAAALRLRTENVAVMSDPFVPVEGFFDVYVDVAPGFNFAAAGYDVAIKAPAGSGVTLVSAGPSSAAHPSLFTTTPIVSNLSDTLRVTDSLESGAVPLDNGDGLFRVRFTVAPGSAGEVPLSFTTAFTNIADGNGLSLPIDRAGGTITITELPAPHVTQVLVRGSNWSQAFLDSLGTEGLGYAIPAGQAQLADLTWNNVNQVIVQFNEAVSVQQNDLVVRGVNTATYATTGFNYDPASFTAVWTLAAPLAADKILLQLAAGGADPIRNTAGERLDGDWSNGTSAYPSGNGQSGGDFLFRMNVLPGNVDRDLQVNVLDTVKTRNHQFTAVGAANYDPLFDVNGSGNINIFDTIQVRNNQFTSLPGSEPVVPAPSPAARPTMRTASVRLSPLTSIGTGVNQTRPKLSGAARIDVRALLEVYRLLGTAEERPDWLAATRLLRRRLGR